MPAPRTGDDSLSLNKYISDTGFCSRREADDYIAQGRAFINDKTAHKGNRVKPGDVVTIDGEPLRTKAKPVYLACHKPKGITTTTDTKDRTNIISYLNHQQRIFPVGRLDKDSEGLLFLTNDGDIVNRILRAGNNHEKEYVVTVDKPVTPEFTREMAAGVKLDGAYTKACRVKTEGKTVFRITLTQGLNRQIRRMCEALGYKVTRLIRVRIMNVTLGKLAAGEWRYLTADEVADIQKLVATSSKTEEASVVKTARREHPEKKIVIPKEKAPAAKKTATKKTRSYKDFRKEARNSGKGK